MLSNRGNIRGLFRAAFMESGSAMPVGYVDEPYLQQTYDTIVSETGCAGSGDTLECLRGVPVEVFMAATKKTPSVFSYEVRSLVTVR